MKPVGIAEKRCQSLMEQAIAGFANHQIVASGVRPHTNGEDGAGLGWWVIRRVLADGYRSFECWTGWTEIIEGFGGQLYVNGDIDAMVFSRFPTTTSTRPGEMARWMGRRPRPDDDYFGAKSRAGMSLEANTQYDASAALEEFETWLADCDEDAEEIDPDTVGYVRGCIADGDPLHVALEELGDHIDCETWGDWGKVVSARAVYAWAALRRLCELLYSKDAGG